MKCGSVLFQKTLALLLLAFVFSPFLPTARDASTFAVRALSPPAPIEGRWKIRIGDDPEYKSPSFPDNNWDLIDMPGIVAPFAKRATGYAWLRAQVTVHPDLHGRDLGLNLGRVPDAYEVFFNGIRLAGEGRFPTSEGSSDFFYAWNAPAGVVIPAALVRTDIPNTIAIRIFFCNDGGIWDKIQIMEPAALKRDLEFRRFFLNDLCMAIAYVLWAVAVYHLLLFWNRPGEKENVFFAVFCVFISLQIYNFAVRDLPVDYIIKERIVFGLTPVMAAPGAYFFRYYFARHTPFHVWFTRAALLVQFAAAVYVQLSPDIQTLRARYDQTIGVLFISIIYIVFTMVQAWRSGNRKAKLIAIGFGLTMLMAAHDVTMVLMGVRDLISMFNYALPTLLFSIALVLGHDFVTTRNQVEDLNATLEKKVAARTQELSSTLDEVRELKQQQDGDYFLTSILIQPLSEIKIPDGPVSVQALVNQKKHFSFRKWEADIGGDICSAHMIRLRGRRYAAFMNGDAMGKSMQGAGGAIVLGTVYNAVITRTQKSAAAQKRFPEQWLKECFLELQDVFVSFDGTMLASAVLGLVDEDSGFVYYINAEHPRTVLYRTGRASFMEEEQAFRKLGITGLEGRLFLRTQQLEPGDVMIIGSDGRDDLLTGTDADQRRMINQDENLFLRCVEEGGGNLDEIKNAVLRHGKLTDDFSLLRISFREDAPVREPLVPDASADLHLRLSGLLHAGDVAGATSLIDGEGRGKNFGPDVIVPYVRMLLRSGAHDRASRIAQECADRHPESTELLYQCAMSMKIVGQTENAADYGERLLLRAPGNTKNLINLADIYRMMGNTARAFQMLDRARKIDPQNKNIAAIEARMPRADQT